MNQEKIVLGEQETPVLSLRKKLVGQDDGLNVYSKLEKDEEEILIPFTVSLFITSEKSKIMLRKYVSDLKKGVCWESLGIDFGQMSKKDYWLGKCVKLKRDMEAMGAVPMKAHGFECNVMGFKPETTMDLYHAIEANLVEIAELIGETDRLLMAAPLSLYGHYYRYQKSLCDPQPVAEAHGHWKRDVGSLTYDLLKDRQVFVVTEFLKQKILRHTLAPSEREIGEVNFEEIKKHLSKESWDRLPDEFPKCCARFHRFVSWEDGILRLDHDQWGNYLFQFFHQLTPEERQAFIELDLMLELIHEDMRQGKGVALPEALATPDAEKASAKSFDTDTPLSALFRESHHEQLGRIIESWRPCLMDTDPDKEALQLSTFHFDLNQIQPSTVYLDFARLISLGTLMVPMSNLATYMFSHSNLSKSENALYVQLKRYKKMCEQTRKKS